MPFELPAGYEEQEPIPFSEQQKNAQQPDIDIDTSRVDDDSEDSSEKLGPFAEVSIDNPIGQFMEDASVAIIDAFDDRDADEIREERSNERAIQQEGVKTFTDRFDSSTNPVRESMVAIAGGVEDFGEALVNLPGDAASLLPGVDDDFMNVDFTYVRENNTEWGKAARTLARYVIAGRQAQRIPGFNRLTAGQQGRTLFAGRAVEGFIEDFIGSDGTGEDSTILGSTPWTQAFQTSDDNNPVANRALNGLEGALFNATGGWAIDAVRDLKLWGKFRSSAVGRKFFPGVKQDPEATRKAAEARGRLNDMLAKTYADDQYGKTLNYTLKVQQDFALRAITDARQPLNDFIEKASKGNKDVAAYLNARTRGLAAANRIDKTYNTVKYGGEPDEQVIDGLTWTGIQRQMDELDQKIKATEDMSAGLDTRVAELSEDLTQQSALSGRRAADIQDLQTRSLNAPRRADLEASQNIPLNLSAYQVKYLKDNKLLPRGITITPGRRVKGLTSSNIDDLISAVEGGPEAKVRDNLLKRFPNVERPAPIDESIDTIEGLNEQVKGLQAEAKAADDAAVLKRQELEPLFAEQTLARQMLKQLKFEREAMYSRFNGQDVEFKAKAEEIKAQVDPDLPPQKVDEIVQKSEQIQPTTRKEAMEAGKTSDQLIPTKARPALDTGSVRTESNVGTANPTPMRFTEADYRSLTRDNAEFLKFREIGEQLYKISGRTDAEIVEAMQSQLTDDLTNEIKELFGDELDRYLRTNPDFATRLNDGRYYHVSIEGREAANRVIRELQIESKELAQTITNQLKEGAPEAVMNMERLNERFKVLVKILKEDTAARGSHLRELAVIADNTGSKVSPQNSELLQELIDRNNDILARQEQTFNVLMAIGDEIRTDPKSAARRISRAINAYAISENIASTQVDIIKALTFAHLKNADGYYINSILSGLATQARNFWGNFYQATGHPLLAMVGTHLPGKVNKTVRLQAVASLGASLETYMEITDLIPRIYNRNLKQLDFDSPNYQVWDEDLTKEMAKIEAMRDSGQLSWAAETIFATAINFRKFLLSPFMSPMMRLMGSVDSFFKVVAGRQIIAQRAVVDALDALGDRPLTSKSSAEFADLVAQYKKKHELDVFGEDKLTLIDDEANELAQVFTFQKPLQDTDRLTKTLNQLASIPGGRLLGLTFVKTPSQILKGSLGLTPGLSTLMKRNSKAYQNGSDYYRAMRDGQEALSYIIGTVATALGAGGALTGAGPLDGQSNKEWQKAGNKPFTLKLPFGGEINYQGLEPATTVIGLFADIGQLGIKGELGLDTVAAAIGSNIINKSYLAQVATAAKILSTNNRDQENIAANITRGIIPYSGMRSQVGQLIDPYIREHRSAIEPTFQWFIKKNFGLGASTMLPAKTNPLTSEPLTRDGFGTGGGNMLALINMFSPLGMRFSLDRTDPLQKMLFDAGVNIDEETRGIADVDLTNDEMVEFKLIRASNGKLKQDLLDYFNSDQYKEVDKPNSDLRLEQGQEHSDTPVYERLMQIIGAYSSSAKSVMKLGQTKTSRGFKQRLDDAIQEKLKLDRDYVRRQDTLRFPSDQY